MSFFQNTCKPEGFAGKLMVSMMNAGHTPMAEWGFSHIQVANDAACLDIGCGGGANLRRLLKKCPQGHVTGIDYSDVSVESSQKATRAAIEKGRCTVLQGNVMALPFDEGTFDLVTAFETVYFWPDIGEAFAQVRRVLKAGGSFLICNELNGENPGDKKWTEKIQGMRLYTAGQLKAALENAGFSHIMLGKTDAGWLCLVCKR